MGGFYGSVNVRTNDRAEVVGVLDEVAKKTRTRFLVSPPLNGWVSVYPSGSGQDEKISRQIARRLGCDILHLISYHEEVFLYFFYRDGKLLDRYSSRPDQFREVSPSLRRKLRGRPELFRDLFADRRALDEVKAILAHSDHERLSSHLPSSHLMVEFAKRLKIADSQTSYEYLRDEDNEDVEGWEAFIHVPDRTAEEARKRG